MQYNYAGKQHAIFNRKVEVPRSVFKTVFKTEIQFSKQEYSFQNRNTIFKTEIQFSNHKSSAKSSCFQIMYTEILCVGPLGKKLGPCSYG